MKPAVIFDLDGTLVDSLPLVYDCFRYAVSPFRNPPDDEEIEKGLCGPVEKNLLRLLSGDEESVLKARERLGHYARENQDRVTLFPGAGELLESLAEESADLGLWTGRDRKSTLRILDQFQLKTLFKGIVCGDDLKTHKPDPEGMLTLIGVLETTAANTLFVGDSEHDIQAGKNSGVRTIICLNGHHPAIRPDGDVVASLFDLKPLLLELLSEIRSGE